MERGYRKVTPFFAGYLKNTQDDWSLLLCHQRAKQKETRFSADGLPPTVPPL